jgi:hypothetical protein
MVTFFITSVLVLGLLALAIYFWQKPANKSQSIELPSPQPRGLFSDFSVNQLRVPAPPNDPADERSLETKVNSNTFDEAIQAIRAFEQSPDRSSTTKLLHIAALTDDAKNYGRAVDLVLMSWRDGSLADLSAVELQTLINSEYWVLSSRTRTSGAGFVLKDSLATAKRELERTNNSRPSTASS